MGHTMIKIFDLDGTVIDSSHRQQHSEGGTLSLSHWKANSTRELIMRDKALPLARQMRLAYKRGDIVIVCTARTMSEYDHASLDRLGLRYHAIVSRPEGNTLPDSALKLYGLLGLCGENGLDWQKFCAKAVMYDDNLSVIEGLTAEGIRVYNSTILNRELAA